MEKYELIKKVGEGSFGQVFKAKRIRDGAIVAYKIMEKQRRTSRELKSLRRECKIQKDMRHPNIIQMLDSFETDTEIIVVIEYVEKVLHDVLAKARKLSEVRAQVVACDLVSALHYLHSKRIVHRDMKPQNVLLDPHGVAKLCDFGFARSMNENTYVLMSVKGTPLYMAPELIEELPYDHNVDLWSLGCIVYELVTGKPPFQTTSMLQLINDISKKEIEWPDYISDNLRSFLQGLLQKNPINRLTWPHLLDHPFVKGRILTVDEDAPRALTSPLSASQARAKQQQLQSLASRFASHSKKILDKHIKKIHSQVMRKSSGSESSTSVEVLLNNLSLRASLRSDLLAADYAICETDCPIAEEDFDADQQQQIYAAQNENVDDKADNANANVPENPLLLPPACCLAALQATNPNLAAAWLLDLTNPTAATAAAAACCLAGNNYCRSDSYCLSALNNTNSPSCMTGSLDDNNEGKRTNASSSRLSSERDAVVVDSNVAERQGRLKNWTASDLEQPIENEEWVVFLQKSMEEMMEGEIGSLIQENCMTVFVSTLKNPGASCRVVEYVACLLSLPFVLGCVSGDDLERIQQVYLDVRVAPNLVYAVKLLMTEKNPVPDTDGSTSTMNNKWRSAYGLSADELQALESTMLILCRLIHAKKEFLVQFCDAVFLVPDGLAMFQQLLKLEKRRSRIVSDLIAVLSEVLRSETGNTEIVSQILLKARSTDDLIDLFTKLITHKQSKLRTRVCILLLLLGKFSRSTLQRIWGKSLRNLLEGLAEDREKSVRDAATNAISSLKQLPFYNQEKDTWSVIDT